jgi:hypothetical protein
MGRAQLTGPGQQRMQALDDALAELQGIHSIVEKLALAQRTQQPLQPWVQQLRRQAAPLAERLKGQYGVIADQLTQMVLVATRGGSELRKVVALREGVAGVRAALEIAQRKVIEQYSAEGEAGGRK